ncbi:MAG: acyl dehydratase, partial [Actinomycetes bacterium]
QVTRSLPNLVTVLGWKSCDHTGPVREGDTVTSRIEVLSSTALTQGAAVELRSVVTAHVPGGDAREVLDWRYTALVA